MPMCEFRDVRLSMLYPGSPFNIGSCISGLSVYREFLRVGQEAVWVVDFP